MIDRDRAAGWPRAAVGGSLAVSALFIARSATTVSGRLSFTLFDDAMISMQYARNVVAGDGLVWIPGDDPVEGFTNPLWTAVMAVVHLLPLGPSGTSLVMVLLGAAILATTVFIVHRLTARLVSRGPWALVAALGTATFYPLVFWTLRGMEVGLAALVIAAACLLVLAVVEPGGPNRRLFALGAVMAVGVMTRHELVIPLGVIGLWAVLGTDPPRRLATAWRVVALPALSLLVVQGFRLQYYGEWVPNTAVLKLGGIPLVDRLSRGTWALGFTLSMQLLLLVILAGLALWGGVHDERRRTSLRWMATVVLAEVGYHLWVGGDAWESFRFANRYLTSVAPILIVLATVGLARLVRAEVRLSVAAGIAVAAVIAGLGLLNAADGLAVDSLQMASTPTIALVGRAVVFIAVALVVLVVVGRASSGVPLGAGITGIALVAVLVATNAEPVTALLLTDSHGIEKDGCNAEVGLLLADATDPTTTIAVATAGAIPYWSERPAVDLLGKSDPVVAELDPDPRYAFQPGHGKWDYDYSIGELRPDVVVQLWREDEEGRAVLEAAGYRNVAKSVWVGPDIRSDQVDEAGLVEVAERLC